MSDCYASSYITSDDKHKFKTTCTVTEYEWYLISQFKGYCVDFTLTTNIKYVPRTLTNSKRPSDNSIVWHRKSTYSKRPLSSISSRMSKLLSSSGMYTAIIPAEITNFFLSFSLSFNKTSVLQNALGASKSKGWQMKTDRWTDDGQKLYLSIIISMRWKKDIMLIHVWACIGSLQ